MFGTNFDYFSGAGHRRSGQRWKRGPDDSVLHPKHTRTVWGAVIIISVSTPKKCFGWILTFLGSSTTEVGPKQSKLKTGAGWLSFTPETYPHYLRCTSYHFPSVRLKMFRLTFDDSFRLVHHRSKQIWKSSLNVLILHPKHTHTICRAILFVSRQYARKMFWSNFDDFFEPGHPLSRPGAGRVENRARMTPFCTWNIPTLFGCCSYFPVSTTEKCFNQILTTFLGPGTTRAVKYPHYLGWKSYRFPSVRLKNILVKFCPLFRHFRKSPEGGKVENRAQMTRFYTWNILALFGM